MYKFYVFLLSVFTGYQVANRYEVLDAQERMILTVNEGMATNHEQLFMICIM